MEHYFPVLVVNQIKSFFVSDAEPEMNDLGTKIRLQ